MKHLWDSELSEREIYFIGAIFVQWGALEHEIFLQTLKTFEPEEDSTEIPVLPKEMNNLQFSGVLELWNERVAVPRRGKRGKVLQQQFEEIRKLKDARDAIAHGMWHWKADNPGEIRTVRIRKREIITSRFSGDFMGEMASKIGEINFSIRFPGGLIDLARKRVQNGGYMSRRWLEMVASGPDNANGYPTSHPAQGTASSDEAGG